MERGEKKRVVCSKIDDCAGDGGQYDRGRRAARGAVSGQGRGDNTVE